MRNQSMPEDDFLKFRTELLRAATMMSCTQTLDLADLLHTVIRMRKPRRPLRNLDGLFLGEAEGRSFEPDHRPE